MGTGWGKKKRRMTMTRSIIGMLDDCMSPRSSVELSGFDITAEGLCLFVD